MEIMFADLCNQITATNRERETLELDLMSARSLVQSLQDTVSSSKITCEELLTQIDELQTKKDSSELNEWQSQVKNLETTLENAKSESEKKAKDLSRELELARVSSEKKTEISRYIVPAATATGALAAAGVMYIIKSVSRR
jgi:chromosome segregation ATPase